MYIFVQKPSHIPKTIRHFGSTLKTMSVDKLNNLQHNKKIVTIKNVSSEQGYIFIGHFESSQVWMKEFCQWSFYKTNNQP